MTRLTASFMFAPRRGARSLAALMLCLGLAFLAGCAHDDYDKTAGWSAQQLYASAQEDISDSNWTEARTRLQAVVSRYPFGIYAQQSLMDLIYVEWKDGESDQAMADIGRFQQLYPNHDGSDYVLYMKGIVSFTPDNALFMRVTQQNPAERDPKGIHNAYLAFTELVKRYPDSKYSAEARQRIAWLVNAMAEHEVDTSLYYYNRGAYVASADRAQQVITNFPNVPATEQALTLMVMAYDKLHMTQLRDDAQRVLNQNFPHSTLLATGFKKQEYWWDPTTWF